MHLFHSQSERMSRYFAKNLRAVAAAQPVEPFEGDGSVGGGGGGGADGDGGRSFPNEVNFAVAVRMALGKEGLSEVLSHMGSGGGRESGAAADVWEDHDAAAQLGWIEKKL